MVTGALLLAVTLGGCAIPGPHQSDPQNEAQALWSARVEFVGDNSGVAALAQEAGFERAGAYALSLQTQQAPYAITLTFDSLDESYDEADFRAGATLMLGLVANLDQVSVASSDRGYSMTASDASEVLGFDVKQLGRDEGELAGYLGLARD